MQRILLDHPDEFKEGVRILMLCQRGKDGGGAKPDRATKTKKVVARSVEEFNAKLAELDAIRTDEERIYSTVNARSMNKAIRIFKQRQLDADYYSIDEHHSFYTDIWNRWISALQAPQVREGTQFLVDIDIDINDLDGGLKMADEVRKLEQIPGRCIHWYETKNGYHLITTPFNPSLTELPVQKDAMMLWAYSK